MIFLFLPLSIFKRQEPGPYGPGSCRFSAVLLPGGILHSKRSVEHRPPLGPGPHQIPEAAARETVLLHQLQFGGQAPGILEPDLPPLVVPVRVLEPGTLHFLVILDGRAGLNGQGHRLLVGQGRRPGDPLPYLSMDEV